MIDCVTNDGRQTPCEELDAPVSQCSTGASIDFVRFRITDASCGDSSNTQNGGGGVACADGSSSIPAEGSTVYVSCAETGSYGFSAVVASATSAVG